MIKCNTCNWVKKDDDFYASNQSRCKECVKYRVRKNRYENIEYYRDYDSSRANLAHRVEARNIYIETEAGVRASNKAKKKWCSENAVKKRASNAVNNAVRDGRLSKPDYCSHCGKSGCRIEGHHDDYDKVLDVTWLCSACHRDWHKKYGQAKNA